MREESGRHLLGVAIGDGHFSIYPEVTRVVEWIEQLANEASEVDAKPLLRRVAPATPEVT